MKITGFVICGALIAGCSSSPPAPSFPAADLQLSCADVSSIIEASEAEVARLEKKKSNSFKAGSYLNESSKIMVKNPLAGVGALILFPLISDRFTDQDEADLEQAIARNAHHTRLASHKNCPAEELEDPRTTGDLIELLDIVF